MSTTTSFSYAGAAQTWTAPENGIVNAVLNGPGVTAAFSANALGGQTTLLFKVNSGDILQVNVGGGVNWADSPHQAGGWNGGGAAYTNNTSTGGAGATDIRLNGTDLNSRIAVAGGAGGHGNSTTSGTLYIGGTGGGATGGTTGSGAGKSGTQTAGGAGTIAAGNGSFGVGGPGTQSNGAGGGGGWYGGGGSGNYGGGGGSGYCATTVNGAPASGTTTAGAGNLGNGDVTLTFHADSEPYFRSGASINTQVCPVPAGIQVGDLLFCVAQTLNTSNTIFPPSGWTGVSGTQLSGGAWWRIATSADVTGSQYTFTNAVLVMILAYHLGPNALLNSVVTRIAGAATTVTPTLPNGVAGQLYVTAAARSGAGDITVTADDNPVVEFRPTPSNEYFIAVDAPLASSGTTPQRSFVDGYNPSYYDVASSFLLGAPGPTVSYYDGTTETTGCTVSDYDGTTEITCTTETAP